MVEVKKISDVWCRQADEKVLIAWEDNTKRERKVSVRDTVRVLLDGSRDYRLWNTVLVRADCTDFVEIYITDNSDMEHVYYGMRGRSRQVAMTQTTKNRLNAFLDYYGFNALEVHSSKKLFGVWHNGKELSNNTWYHLDFETKELVKE